MARVVRSAIDRMAKATLWVEQHGRRPERADRKRGMASLQPWLGFVRDTSGIDRGATGSVNVAQGSETSPTEDTSTYHTVANPWMGKLLDGTRVLVVPALIVGKTTDSTPWTIAPFHLSYEGKADSTTAAGSTMTFSVWQGGSDTGINLTSVKLPSWTGESMTAGKFGRATWDIVAQSWYIDSKECE